MISTETEDEVGYRSEFLRPVDEWLEKIYTAELTITDTIIE